MQTLESIAQVLRDWGLHAGSWARRHDLARTIAGTHKQFDDAAARALFDEAKDARAARNPAGLVLTWLADGSWVELLADLEHAAQHAQAVLGREHDRNACFNDSRDPTWEHERRNAEVLARALGDREPCEVVAQLCGVTEEQVRDIVREHGSRWYSQRQVDAFLDPKAAARQLKQAMSAMHKGNAHKRTANR